MSAAPSFARAVWVLPGLLSLVMMLPVAGYRHLNVDEVETGARALTIVDAGLPLTKTAAGELSLNTGGLELEEGDLHRYTPWIQLYAGALGVSVGDALQVARDASLRAPFIAAHAASSSLLTHGMLQVGVHPIISVGAGLASALATGRVLHNRTARYHAFLDLFVVVALTSMTGMPRARRRVLTAVAIAALPHVQTIGGCIAAGGIVVVMMIRWWNEPERMRLVLWTGVLPLFIGVASVALLTRPWALGPWTVGVPPGTTASLLVEPLTPILPAVVLLTIALLARREWQAALQLLMPMAAMTIVIAVIDITQPYSQPRYYLWLLMFVAGASLWLPRQVRGVAALGAILMFLGGEIGSAAPFHGAAVVMHDRTLQAQQAPQPLREALSIIAADPKRGDVSIDYVPQFVDWYLPGHGVALVPDPSAKTPLNASRPEWDAPTVWPEWDLFYPSMHAGTWHCRLTQSCSFHREYFDDVTRYDIVMRDGRRGPRMCVVGHWMADPTNHTWLAMSVQAGLRAEGVAIHSMILGRRCRDALR